ncbi:MAG: ABC transporter ATP-binding protein [Alphaproteobacteria bacterium]
MSGIVLRNITVTRGARCVVDDAAAHLNRGEMVGLIGPNGAGKSSLLSALAGVLPHQGEIEIDGQAAPAMTARNRARAIAYLPQERRVDWPVTVERLVMLGRLPHLGPFRHPAPADQAAVAKALAAVDAIHLKDRTATRLSGGEMGRVLMARALAVGAPYLLADEPVAALDPAHRLRTMETLKAHAIQNHGVLVVLHDLGLAARYCDRLIVMNTARIVADGPPGNVLNDKLLADIYGITALRHQEQGALSLTPWETIDDNITT